MNAVRYKICAVAAAAAYALAGAAVLGHHVPDAHWGARGAVVDACGAAAFLLTALALERLMFPLGASNVGRWGARAAQVGLGAMTVESLASLIHGGNTLGIVFFAGLMLSLVGMTAVAVVGLRAGGLRWAAPLPALGLLVGIAAGDHGGFLATAAVWVVLALAADRLGAGTSSHEPESASASRLR